MEIQKEMRIFIMVVSTYAIFLIFHTCINCNTCSVVWVFIIRKPLDTTTWKKDKLTYPSDCIICWRRSLTCAASRGANRNLVHLDCRAGMILLTLLHINANLVLFVCFSITAHKDKYHCQGLQWKIAC